MVSHNFELVSQNGKINENYDLLIKIIEYYIKILRQ